MGGPFDADDAAIYDVRTRAPGPPGRLPVTADNLVRRPSGNLFGWTQDVGMGLPARELGRPEVLLLATCGGVRAPDGTPIALGYHTGHWEIGLLVEEAARALRAGGSIPFAGFVTDPCDGRTQGTTGMFDSLPYRDTRGLEQSYLARGQAQRVAELEAAVADTTALVLRTGASVAMTALVTVEEDGTERRFFVAPHGGGSELAGGVQVVTPSSPLGRALIGKRLDDEIEVRLPGGTRNFVIVGIE